MHRHKAGRPSKPASKRRQQLHISLYPEDIERLDELTKNRSEFIRHCIDKAWEEKHVGEVTVTLTLPKWLLQGMVKTAEARLPADQLDTFYSLVGQIVSARDHNATEHAATEHAATEPIAIERDSAAHDALNGDALNGRSIAASTRPKGDNRP